VFRCHLPLYPCYEQGEKKKPCSARLVLPVRPANKRGKAAGSWTARHGRGGRGGERKGRMHPGGRPMPSLRAAHTARMSSRGKRGKVFQCLCAQDRRRVSGGRTFSARLGWKEKERKGKKEKEIAPASLPLALLRQTITRYILWARSRKGEEKEGGEENTPPNGYSFNFSGRVPGLRSHSYLLEGGGGSLGVTTYCGALYPAIREREEKGKKEKGRKRPYPLHSSRWPRDGKRYSRKRLARPEPCREKGKGKGGEGEGRRDASFTAPPRTSSSSLRSIFGEGKRGEKEGKAGAW